MSEPTGRFTASDRLLSSRDFSRVRERGVRVSSRYFVISVATRDPKAAEGTKPRLGLTVSRRVGNAVQRNRVKRCIREWFRASRDRFAEPGDVVVIARKGAADQPGPSIASELESLLGRL